MSYYGGWKPYVSVAKRRERALKKMATLRKQGVDIQPVQIEGRKIAKTFWGEAWCDHLESFSDYENRLPRGRTYVRNGSVCHLAIKKGQVIAKVSGSEIYEVKVKIKTLSAKQWNAVKSRCSGQIGSLLELLRGDLSDNIMQVVTDRKTGLFPSPSEISFGCDCPDWASMCKHVAAVLYGVGARLDQEPALLFRLRGVNHEELIDVDEQVSVPAGSGGGAKRLATSNLSDVFGIDLASNDPDESSAVSAKSNGKAQKKAPKKKSSKKVMAVKKKSSTRRSAPKKTSKKTVKKQAIRKHTSKKTSVQAKQKDAVQNTAPRKSTKKKKVKRKTAQPVA